MKHVNIFIELCRDGVIVPQYARLNDSGMDVRSAEDVVLKPLETKIIHTGLKVAIPEGFEIQIRPRSGLSLQSPLRIANSPGTIDSGYRDEIGLIMQNISGKEHYLISNGDRIAQLILQEVPRINFIITNDISVIGNDRGGGFGSSGIK